MKHVFSSKNIINKQRCKQLTKYEIAERIRGLLDYDYDDIIDATLELADEVEAEDDEE